MGSPDDCVWLQANDLAGCWVHIALGTAAASVQPSRRSQSVSQRPSETPRPGGPSLSVLLVQVSHVLLPPIGRTGRDQVKQQFGLVLSHAVAIRAQDELGGAAAVAKANCPAGAVHHDREFGGEDGSAH